MNDDIEQIELSIKEAEAKVERRDRLAKLHENKAFRELIVDGYFKDNAVRLVSAYGDPSASHLQADLLKDIEAVGRLQQYFRTIYQQGDAAERALVEAREELEDIRAEDEEFV